MSSYYDDCRTCGASYEERLASVKDNGHTLDCFLYVKYSGQEYSAVKPTDNLRTLKGLGVGYD